MPSDTTLTDARKRVRDLYGEALAEKASDRFLLAAAPIPAEAALEGVAAAAFEAPPGGAPQTVLEFERRRAPTERQDLRRRASAAMLEVLAGVAEALPREITQQAGPAARQVILAEHRDHFLADTSAVRAECEKAAAVFGASPLEAGAGFEQPSFTDVCWLNQTMRVRGDPSTVAEVASDPTVKVIDVPRPLEPDLTGTAERVGAVAYRNASGNGGAGVVVAVIDTEVAAQHPGLVGRVVQKNNYTREAFGNAGSHGTAVAGIIGSGDPACLGVAPEVTIYNYKVIPNNPRLKGTSFDGNLAIQQALEDGAHIANCSWGNGPAGDGTSAEAVACDEAWVLGLTIVKSAGNKGPGGGTLTTPADAEGVIVVGATDRRGTAIERYSSRGPTGGGVSRPHLCAPGGSEGDGVISALITGGFGDCGWGTSYAAPHVSGLAALLLAHDPGLDPEDIRAGLIAATTLLQGFDKEAQGKGFVRLTPP